VPIEKKDDRESDARIAELVRELASAINESEGAGRVEAREYAIDVLREATESQALPDEGGKRSDGATGPLNPFALGIPLILVGLVLVPLFAPVGLALSLGGLAVCVGGMAVAVVRSGVSLLQRRRSAGLWRSGVSKSKDP
jgi:hypothetical protein